MKIIKQIAQIFIDKKWTLATAESCTGGMIASEIVGLSGASEFFKGGVVAYSNDIKQRILKVPVITLNRYGAVSAQTVRAMAEGAEKLFHCDCAIAVSGIAGPGGGGDKKPVGLVFIAIKVKSRVSSYQYLFKGNRQSVRTQACTRALERLLENFQ